MRIRAAISAVAIAALLIPTAAVAQNGNGKGGKPTYQVSGGGQIVVDTNGFTGPGTTIAFVAQGQGEDGDENARGRLQVVERLGAGPPTNKFHGIVDCIVPAMVFEEEGNGQMFEGARFGGYKRGGDPEEEEDRFLVDVIESEEVEGDFDLVAFYEEEGDEDCENGDEPPEPQLARGNVKIHDRRPNNE